MSDANGTFLYPNGIIVTKEVPTSILMKAENWTHSRPIYDSQETKNKEHKDKLNKV